MRRHPSLIPLSHDHRSALFIAQNLKKNSPKFKGYPIHPEDKCIYATHFFDRELLPHLALEEKILFPYLIGSDEKLDAIIHELDQEHELLRGKFLQMHEEMADLVNFMDELGHEFEKHIRKEERIFFQHVQKILDKATIEDLGVQIQAFKSMLAA